MYDLVQSMYFENMCAVKIRDKLMQFKSDFFCVVHTNELAVELDQCAAPGLSLLDREVKSLFNADDLALLSPTAHGPQ